ncbi:hypothetical protein [Leucobacter massiliensis]|nr:hypothetical protein [Leucobacter massiliensis]
MTYGGTEYEFDERVLAHVKVAVAAKLRRQESFFVNWTKDSRDGSGRVSLWVSPYVPISFRFLGSRSPELNPRWLRALTHLSGSSRGLTILSEKEAERYAERHCFGVPAKD